MTHFTCGYSRLKEDFLLVFKMIWLQFGNTIWVSSKIILFFWLFHEALAFMCYEFPHYLCSPIIEYFNVLLCLLVAM